jgi:Flp pilus assembly protein TadB
VNIPPENDQDDEPARPVDRTRRIPEARRVIAGSDVRPPSTLSSNYLPAEGGLTPPQRTYFIAVAVLLVVSIVIWLVFSFGVASIFFFLLALTLIAGWLIF